jgi:transposase InsO family protein
VLAQPRSTQRRARQVPADEPRLLQRIVALASDFGRYGYRRVTALLRGEGWVVNHKRVERLWRQEGLKGARKGVRNRKEGFSQTRCGRT